MSTLVSGLKSRSMPGRHASIAYADSQFMMVLQSPSHGCQPLEIELRARVAGLNFKGAREPDARFVIFPLLRQRGSQIIAGLGIRRINAQGVTVMRNRFVKPA